MRDFKSVGKLVGGNEGDTCNYPYRLDTYGCGCSHDCKYCYAKSLLEFRGLWDANNPSVGDIQKIQREVKKIRKGTVVRLGGMTDCFQACEKIHRVTYKTIKALNRRRIEYLIITKSPMITDAEYLDILDKDLAHIQFTLTFTDDELYKRLKVEQAPLPSKRIEAIEKLQEAGYDICVRLSPYIPEFIDNDVLKAINCDKMLVEFLRINHWIEKWLGDKIDTKKYNLNFHGYNHLPFKVKRDLIKGLEGRQEITVCDFEPQYLDYWKKEYNPNKEDCCNLRRRPL